MSNLNTITLDFREFHPFIKQELIKYHFLSAREIDESTILSLIESVLVALCYLKNNLEMINGVGRISYLFCFYSLNDFIEIFDDLQISFSSFLELKGITRDRHYYLYRPDNFRAVFIEYEKVLYI